VAVVISGRILQPFLAAADVAALFVKLLLAFAALKFSRRGKQSVEMADSD
jgi:hypothetical protein